MADTPHPSSGSDDLLQDLVAQCIEAMHEHGRSGAEAVLAAHPAHASVLRDRLSKLERAGLLPGADDEPSEEVPERLGEYRLLRRIGSGGMGVVFLAEQTSLGRQVALKLVRPEQRFFPGARARFRREVDAIARLGDPGIVPIFAVGQEHGIDYFTMEHVRGASLADVLADVHGRAPGELAGRDFAVAAARRADVAVPDRVADVFAGTWEEAACRIVITMARSLQHAHERGVVHRDVKPNNVMITPEGRVLLLDFGLASAAGSERITRSGAQLGTLHYMAPEQLRDGEIGTAVDVYALGVTLHELLALRSPFGGVSFEELRHRILTGAATDLRVDNRDVPRDLATVVAVAMDPDARRRYPSAEAFADDLERFLRHRPIQARPVGRLLRLQRWSQRRPALATAAALGIVSAVVAPLTVHYVRRAAAAELAEAQQQSRNNLRGAVDAVASLVQATRNETLRRTPGIDEERLRQLTVALTLIEDLAQRNPDDTAIQVLYVEGLANAAALQSLLGRAAESLAAAERAQERLDRLPERPDLRESLSLGRLEDQRMSLRLVEATALVGLGRQDEAAALWQAIAQQYEGRTGEELSLDVLLGLSSCHNNLGKVAHAQGDLPTARQHLERALQLDARIARSQLTTVQVVDGVRTRINLAGVLYLEGDHDGARANYEGVLAALQRLMEDQGDDPELHREFARTEFALARTLAEPTEVDTRQSAAVERLRALVNDFPDRVEYRRELGVIASEVAGGLQRRKRLDEARVMIDLAVTQHEEFLARAPDNPEVGTEYCTFRVQRGVMRFQAGDNDAAIAELDGAVLRQQEIANGHPDPYYRMQVAALASELGLVHARLQRWEDSRRALTLARDRYEELAAAGHQPAKDLQKLPKLLMILAQVELMCDDLAAVVQTLSRHQELVPWSRKDLAKLGRDFHVHERADFKALLESVPE